ncbi:hypothetical protein ACOAKC_09000 [Hathewaya histolytica]|uniref:hypothetical protein n=1 Tax=Hathewaya histolytica TaxID=1498 RepID=UPI003B67F508
MLKMKKTIASTLIVTFLATMLPVKVLAVENSYNQYEEKEVVEEVKESKIVKEEEEKREKNIKHFLKEDSTYEAVVYPDAVHYKEDGKWKEIDNSLVESKDEEFRGTQKPEEKK